MSISRGPKIVTNGLVLALDAADMNSYSPNVHPNSNDIYGWCSTAGLNSCTITRDSSMVRQGGSTPLKMTITGTDPYIASYGNSAWNLATASNGQIWTVSVYAKASTVTTGELFFFGADSSGGYGGAGTYGGSVTVNIGTSWTRVSASFTINGANVAYAQTRLDGTQAGGSGSIIWWDGLQVERSSAPTPFNPNYYGDTVWKDLSGNNRTGTLTNGPLFSSNNRGNITFDGTDDFTDIVYLPQQTNSPLSVFAWVYLNALPAPGNTYGIWGHYGSGSVNCHFEMQNALSRVRLGDINNISLPVFNTGSWVHTGFASTGTSHTYYVNGQSINTWSGSTGTILGNPGSINHMVGRSDAGRPWNGRIACINVYTSYLSSTNVLQNYNAQKSRFGL